MKSNELRLGNKVFKHSVYYTIRWYDFEDSEIDTDMGIYFNPIELTPEILEKAGFKKEFEYWVMGEFNIRQFRDEFFAIALWSPTESETMTKILSLHQLQNLYFALTGSELDITL